MIRQARELRGGQGKGCEDFPHGLTVLAFGPTLLDGVGQVSRLFDGDMPDAALGGFRLLLDERHGVAPD